MILQGKVWIRICILSALIGAYSDIDSQIEFFQPGAEWYYGYRSVFVQSRGFTKYIYSRDTMIAGVDVKIIDRTNYILDYENPTFPIDSFFYNPLFMRQSGDSILLYTPEGFKLKWRMDLAVGETFVVDEDDFLSFTMHVDSVLNVMHEDNDVQLYFISGDSGLGPSGNTVIADLFGPLIGFIYYYDCWGAFDCSESVLCRYKNDELGTVDFEGVFCDNFTTSIDIIAQDPLEIYPNPFSSGFTIKLDKSNSAPTVIELYALTGKLVFSQHVETTTTQFQLLPDIPSGAYMGRVFTGHEVLNFKIIKE